MAAPISVQQLKDASEDAITLSDFINQPKNVMIPRRLATDINSLQYYLEYMKSSSQRSYETYVEMVSNASNFIGGASVFVTNDPDNLKNGIYTYNGTTFVRGDYQPENIAKQFVEEKLGGLQVFDGKIKTQDIITGDGSTQETKNVSFDTAFSNLPVFVSKKLPSSEVTYKPFDVERTQEQKNAESVTPFDFGLIGDGLNHPVSERFSTLTKAKAQYPHVTALTDSIDWAALQAFFNHCHDTKVVNANATCKAYINKPIEFRKQQHSTNVIYGNLELITNEALDFMLGMAGLRFIFLGSIKFVGKSAGTPTGLVTKCGLLLGDLVQGASLGSGANMYIHAVEGENLTDCLVHWGNNTHFSAIGQVRGIRIGSGMIQNEYLSHSATFSGATYVSGDINQKSILPVSSLPPVAITTAPVACTINGQLYAVINIDRAQSIIEVYPRLPKTTLNGTLYYHYGCVVRTIGNDTSNLRINTLQTIQCGIGVAMQSLYGLSVGTFSSEALGVATYIGSKGNATVGNNINSGYFETNTWDVAYGWESGSNPLPINTTIALNPAKVVSLADYRLDSNEEMSNGTFSRAGLGDIEFSGVTHNSGSNTVKGELTHPEKYVLVTSSGNINLSFNKDIYRLFGKRSTTFVLVPVLGSLAFDITFIAPVGGTVNGSSNVLITATDYNTAITVTVYAVSDTEFNLTVHTRKAAKKGNTASRPATPDIGQRYYDTTLAVNGKPIEWNGAAWVDGLGNVV